MEYSTKVNVSFNYGGLSLSFSKVFYLGFAPFYNMVLADDNDVHENNIEFKTNEYCKTMIIYEARLDSFLVDVRNIWKIPVTDETVDSTIKTFLDTGWAREDNTDITKLKDLMNFEAKRIEKKLMNIGFPL
jgi:hypothetical protein